MKFIKLTQCEGNDKKIDIYVNVANIRNFQVGNKGKDTMIFMMDKHYFFTTEKPEEILNKINIDTSKAPIIMTAEEALKYYNEGDKV